MKKLIFIFSITILAILASCNDSNQGVLQSAHNATAEERPISSYLGFYKSNDNDVPVPVIMRDGDVYRAIICDEDMDEPITNTHYRKGEVIYSKILDVTNQATGQRDFPFMAYDGKLYMSYKDGDIFAFYYVNIPETGEISNKTLVSARESENNKVTISSETDTVIEKIVEFNASNTASGKVQILYKVEGERRSDCTDEYGNLVGDKWKKRHYGVINWTNSNSLTVINEAMVPTNAIIIGDGILKATTDDPEIEELGDNLNDLYVWRTDSKYQNGHMYTVRTGNTYSNFPLGSDGAYALLADGNIYSIDYNYTEEGTTYDATLTNNNIFTFDVYKREGNYVPFYRDETNKHIIGYISGNGIYWVEDYNDETLEGNATPKLLGISNDNDIIPIAFIGTRERPNPDTPAEPYPEYLIVTQNNGFYVLQPTQGDNNRGKMEKVDPDADYTSFNNFEFIGETTN